MRTRLIFAALLAALFLPACYTAVPRPEAPALAEHPARGTAPHLRSFAGADALAAYLDYGSEAGPLLSAHRGGPALGYPENALATFERSLRYAPVLIEADVRMSADSVLVLMHDETLERTTTGTGPVSEAPLAKLRRLRLVGPEGRVTPFRIPTLDETLAWAEERAVLTLDVKSGVPPERVVEAVRRLGAANRTVVITYTLDRLERYHRLAPELMLSASARTVAEVDALLASGVDPSRLIAFIGVGRVRPEIVERLHAAGVRAMLGTFGAIDERARHAGPVVYRALLERGIDLITTDLVPIAAQAIAPYAD